MVVRSGLRSGTTPSQCSDCNSYCGSQVQSCIRAGSSPVYCSLFRQAECKATFCPTCP